MLKAHRFLIDPNAYDKFPIGQVSERDRSTMCAVMMVEINRLHRAMKAAGVEITFVSPAAEPSLAAMLTLPYASIEEMYGLRAIGERVVAKSGETESTVRAFAKLDAKIKSLEEQGEKIGAEIAAAWEKSKDEVDCDCPKCTIEKMQAKRPAN